MVYKQKNFRVVYGYSNFLPFLKNSYKLGMISVFIRINPKLVGLLWKLKTVGFINSFVITKQNVYFKKTYIQATFAVIYLRYWFSHPALHDLQMISCPSHKVTVTYEQLINLILRNMSSQTRYILSTSRGVM